VLLPIQNKHFLSVALLTFPVAFSSSRSIQHKSIQSMNIQGHKVWWVFNNNIKRLRFLLCDRHAKKLLPFCQQPHTARLLLYKKMPVAMWWVLWIVSPGLPTLNRTQLTLQAEPFLIEHMLYKYHEKKRKKRLFSQGDLSWLFRLHDEAAKFLELIELKLHKRSWFMQHSLQILQVFSS